MYLFLPFLLLTVMCFFFVCVDVSYIFSMAELSLGGTHWTSLAQADIITLSILLMLFVCFRYAYFYTAHYFSRGIAGIELKKIICLFVAVMASLVCTGDFFTTLIFWEYLGVVRFFLILFYRNYLRLRASVVTLVSSRFGDVCLFFLIALSLHRKYYLVATGLIFFFIIFRKRAAFPFVSWLLEAMRAPTPVSSLVHSSTLVAAGVWFSMRYDVFLYFQSIEVFMLLLLITIFVTGVCCFYFLDLKKIVALSTCNNISWCVVYLLFGDVILSLFQLVSHGVSKCLLFMLVGDVMRGRGGSQAGNCVYSSQLYGNMGLFGLFSVILGLSGAPYIGVFFTKHFLLTMFSNSVNIVLFSFLLICVFLSYFYSFRLCRVLMKINIRLSSGVLYSFGSGMMVYFWLFINYFMAGSLDEGRAVGSCYSFILIVFQLVACATAYFFYRRVTLGDWRRRLFGCDNIVEWFYEGFDNICKMTRVFFYRWDNQRLLLFKGQGVSLVTIFKYNLLNISMLGTLLFFISWFILY